MTRRVARWYPRHEWDSPNYARRTAALARSPWDHAGIPQWGGAVTASWWRWDPLPRRTALMARALEWMVRVAHLHVVGAIHSDHRLRRKSCWDDAIHRIAETHAGEPWQDVAQDRDRWARLEGAFIDQILRNPAAHVVPHIGHVLSEISDVCAAHKRARSAAKVSA